MLPACLAPEQQVARLGDFGTESGEVIRDCRVGYRTFGELDAGRSNAVLVAPWFLGTSRQLASQIGPGKLVDSSRFFVIAVDALGNGVSSSPSNSPDQPGARFPRFGVRDMVASQHALVVRVLGIGHLKAVVGISMGGMQALAWATEFPGFVDQVVSVAGTPRTTDGDRRHWREAIAAVESQPAWRRALGALGRLDPRDALFQLGVDPADHAGTARAVMGLDLSARFGGSMERAAAALRARTLVVVSARDEIVDPGPSRELARLAGAELLVLDGRCGHQATRCERAALYPAVRRFLEGAPGGGRTSATPPEPRPEGR
jgi:homoserine O-acetyltransferase